MKKIFALFVLVGILVTGYVKSEAVDRKAVMDSLTTIDPEIRKYFPRWKVCETDLQIQIYRSFKILGYDENLLSQANIEILASPKNDPFLPYDILMITCGKASMNSSEIASSNLGALVEILSGDWSFVRNEYNDPPKRDYCFSDIPPENPVSASQAEAIVSYLEPTNVTHAITLSLFEQTLKLGETGFWIRNIVGTDQVGLPFWSSGESKVVLKRPLYPNYDSETSNSIPYLINAYLGGGYNITSGNGNQSTVLSWISDRKLNASPGGKIVAGIDFSMPFHPQFGVSMNMELPMKKLETESIDEPDYASYPIRDDVYFENLPPNSEAYDYLIPVLRGTGQFTIFYNWWLDRGNPENYIRADFGISYAEVREMGIYRNKDEYKTFITTDGITGLKTYKPEEFGDWIYAKIEFRNQAAFPFGVSLQYSNQTLLGRVYLPIISNWLYIEGKYTTPMRGVRPYENESFFMISPVLRLTL